MEGDLITVITAIRPGGIHQSWGKRDPSGPSSLIMRILMVSPSYLTKVSVQMNVSY